MKERIWVYLVYDLFKHTPGEKLKFYLFIIRIILYPLWTLTYYLRIREGYDPISDIYTIQGVKITSAFIESLRKDQSGIGYYIFWWNGVCHVQRSTIK